MSFVRIVEEKNPVEMHNKVYDASKNNALTPEFCMEVLSHTNVPVIMGKMLEEIVKLPIEEQGQYIEVILSMFDGRQTSEKVKNKALEVAKNLEFESELNKVIKETRKGGYSAKFGVKDEMYVIDKPGDCRNIDFSFYEGVIVNGEIEEEIKFRGDFFMGRRYYTLSGVLDLRGAKKVVLSGYDLSKVTKIIFEEGASVDLNSATNLPKNLDVSMCDYVNLTHCNLEGINLKFREGATVNLGGAKNLPTDLDVSMCDEVDLYSCDLEGINLKFREGGRVDLSSAKNLPKNLDVSMCSVVSLEGCDLEGINLRFKEGAKIDLKAATNLPNDLDASMCDEVDLRMCNLEKINLKFRKGTEVCLAGAKNLPTNLDVSMCECVLFSGDTYFGVMYADISNVKELKFKNEKQMKESQVKIPEDWGGKIIYTDDVKPTPVISKGNDGR